ncbi:MAG: mannose-6-phosphate isomerase, class I [Elusimicrobiota bacterium]
MTTRSDRPAVSGPVLLRSSVRHYDWGSSDYIPRLLGVSAGDKPWAELWMGAHPAAPSRAVAGDREVPLDVFIGTDPARALGPDAASRFAGRLPYLLKVLSAAKPLSIQAHPSKRRAEEGFARENAAGIPLDDPRRNYKDDNHKPELIAALTEFRALRGFRPLDDIARTWDSVPELKEIMPGFRPSRESLAELCALCMEDLAQERVDDVLGRLTARLAAEDVRRPFGPDSPERWVLRADKEFSRDRKDRGIFFIYLLNLISLPPGGALYLDAGEPHAYLEGSGVEIMANSDNVLRGGLTSKRVDVKEFLASLTFECGAARALEPRVLSASESVYETPAAEFRLSRIEIGPDRSWTGGAGPDIFLAVEDGGGPVSLVSGAETLALRKGESAFVPHGASCALKASARAVLFRASLPPSR